MWGRQVGGEFIHRVVDVYDSTLQGCHQAGNSKQQKQTSKTPDQNKTKKPFTNNNKTCLLRSEGCLVTTIPTCVGEDHVYPLSPSTD